MYIQYTSIDLASLLIYQVSRVILLQWLFPLLQKHLAHNARNIDIKAWCKMDVSAPYHRWSPTAPEDFEDTLRSFPRPLWPMPFQFPTTDISIWIMTYTCCSYNYSKFLLLLQDASNCSPILKNPLYHCRVVPCRRNTHTDNSSHLSSIHSFPVVLVFHKRLQNTIWSFGNP